MALGIFIFAVNVGFGALSVRNLSRAQSGGADIVCALMLTAQVALAAYGVVLIVAAL